MATFDPNAGGVISLEAATKLTARFRKRHPKSIKAHYFGNDILKDVFTQAGAVGMRIYYGIDEKGKKQLVLTAVDIKGNDMYNGILADMGAPCPATCDGGGSPLLK